MDPKFKAFRNSIHKIHFSIAGVFLFLFFSILHFRSSLDYALILVGLPLCTGFLVWEISNFKEKRLSFKQDRRTKALTFTALTTSIVSFSLIGTTIVLLAFQYFSFNYVLTLVLGAVGFVVASIMYEDFLPEQVVAEYVVESQAVAP
jgi:hypothetical protein